MCIEMGPEAEATSMKGTHFQKHVQTPRLQTDLEHSDSSKSTATRQNANSYFVYTEKVLTMSDGYLSMFLHLKMLIRPRKL